MPKIVVQVMPKQELLDPAGKAVQRSLAAHGHEHLTDVRIGKRFEVSTEREATPALLEEIAELARDLFSNDVIEDVVSIELVDEVDAVAEPVAERLPTGAASDAQAHENVEER